jgi:hypothetical protein
VGLATRACCPAWLLAWGHWPGWAGWVQPSPCWLGSTQPPKKKKKKEKRVGRIWALGPTLCLLRVCLAKHTSLCLGHNFYAHFSLIFGQTSPFFDIRKFEKYLGIFVDLFVGPSHFDFFFFAFCFF